ncbi:ABC transporter substrate-binding protein [Neptunomonas japonica]|uniref:ABC transporter substrate-binding protein n=1 Tax=Neptunomonas japonica TaxID=417574 RepID=UPI00042A428E|nr:ABC transporter substrate binding protein [Neptunomonas japonica]
MKRYFSKLLFGSALVCFGQVSLAADYKVLVVMSYEEQNPWCMEIREGIDSVLGGSSDITYFYMNTKVDRAGGPKMAQQALNLYKTLAPHGVIAVDDNAQSMLVVPSLKGQVNTPIMFNGVNAHNEKYGYPNSHISGVLERAHVRESLAFAKQLIPSIESACFVTNNVPSGEALRDQVISQQESYPVKVHDFHLVKSLDELDELDDSLREHCDTLFVDSVEGVLGYEQEALNSKEVLKYLNQNYGGPILGGNRYQVEQGAWAAVVKTGQEQGETAAEMLLQAMQGTLVEQIPVVTNTKGQRVINVSALEKNKVPLKPLLLRGAALVSQQP